MLDAADPTAVVVVVTLPAILTILVVGYIAALIVRRARPEDLPGILPDIRKILRELPLVRRLMGKSRNNGSQRRDGGAS